MLAELTFRPYAQADRDSCIGLFDANCPEYFAANERADYEAFLEANLTGYEVCVADNGVVGAFGLIAPGPERASLNWILISPSAHGSGIGSAMMRRVMDQARFLKLRAVSIAASHKSAPFFAKFGAVPLLETKNGWGPGMHRIDMELHV